ncbi:MAG: glycosyltransferase [Acidobacteriaceae bacterium]
MTDWQQKIILVSPFFYPELISTGKANQFLAEAFVAQGNGVTVVCSHPLYPTWIPSHSDARLDGVKILRGGAGVRYPRAMALRRMVLESWFALYACRRVWRLRKNADVLVSVLPPSLFAFLLGRMLPQRTRRVVIVHDLQGVLAAQENGPLRRAIVRLIHAVEGRAFHAQDLCIFFSGDMARAAERSYQLDPARVAVQYPFVTLPPASATPATRLAAMFPADRPHVVYSGALGYKQNSQQLIAFMQAAAQHFPDVDFHVLSGGPFYEQLRTENGPSSLSRVQFHPLVGQQDLAELYARSSIQIIPQAEGTEGGALPSKLPNLLAAGVYPLAICNPDSEVGRLVSKAGTGSIVEKWNVDLFADRLKEALEVVRHESPAVRRTRVKPLLEQFSVGNLVRLALQVEGFSPEAVGPAPVVEVEEEGAAVHSGARS